MGASNLCVATNEVLIDIIATDKWESVHMIQMCACDRGGIYTQDICISCICTVQSMTISCTYLCLISSLLSTKIRCTSMYSNSFSVTNG